MTITPATGLAELLEDRLRTAATAVGCTVRIFRPVAGSATIEDQQVHHVKLEIADQEAIVAHVDLAKKLAAMRPHSLVRHQFSQRYRDLVFPVAERDYRAITDRMQAFLVDQGYDVRWERPHRARPEPGFVARHKWTLTLASVALLGVAAIWISRRPNAFERYQRKSQAAEAWDLIGAISSRAQSYYHGDNRGSAPPHAYPGPSTELTPPKGACCDQGGMCTGGEWFSTPPWTTILGYYPMDEHRYSVQYLVGDDGQSFTVRVVGDLDCDGEHSTYQLDVTPDMLTDYSTIRQRTRISDELE